MHAVRRRAVLVAPASDDRKARKALASAADEFVLDLEDAVTPANKAISREAAGDLVAKIGAAPRASIQINGFESEWVFDDLPCAAIDSARVAVILPKAESPAQLVGADRLHGDSAARLQVPVETPMDIRDITAICSASARLDAVIIGCADLAATLGSAPGAPGAAWHCIQDSILIVARVAGILVVDGPHRTIADDDGFRIAKRWAVSLGFNGTWVLHPVQIDSATVIFTRDSSAIDHTRHVVRGLEEVAQRRSDAAKLDGRKLDDALAASARRLLAKAGER